MILRASSEIIHELQTFAEQDGISEGLRYQSRMLAHAVATLSRAQDAQIRLKALLDQLEELGRQASPSAEHAN